jgi:hypothetical protein
MILLAGCSSGSHAAGSATTAASAIAQTTAAPSTTQASTEWTMAQARTEFTQDGAAVNATAAKLKALPNSASLSELQALFAQYAQQMQTAIAALAAGHWPSTVQPQITALITALASQRVAVQAMATASSMSTLDELTSSLAGTIAAAKGASNVAKAALGLPTS